MSAEDSEYRGERGVFLGATASATDEPRERREYTARGRVILGLLHDKYLMDGQ